MDTLTKSLEEYRKVHNETFASLARRIKVGRTTLIMVSQQKRHPGIDLVRRIWQNLPCLRPAITAYLDEDDSDA